MAYTPIGWLNDQAPSINQTNLNHMDDELVALDEKTDYIDSSIEDISDVIYESTNITDVSITYNARIDNETGEFITASSGKYCRIGRRSKHGSIKATVTPKTGYGIRFFYYSDVTSTPATVYTGNSGSYSTEPLSYSGDNYFAFCIYNSNGIASNTPLSTMVDYVEENLALQEKLTFDATPTENSTNPVTSGGLYTEFQNVKDDISEISDVVYKEIENVWYKGTTTTGWNTGYYQGHVGDSLTTTTSTNYIRDQFRITEERYALLKSALKVRFVPPADYCMRVHVISKATGLIKAVYGQINSSTYPELKGKAIELDHNSDNEYALCMGRFNGDASSYITKTFINSIKFITIHSAANSTSYKQKTGDYEFFTVDVERPLSFGGEEIQTEIQTIECVLRLPNTYDPEGEPTRLILACHGATGYIDSANNTWYNANWKAFMDELLAAGYAVFDSNIFPTSTGTSIMGKANGSPLYVNVLKRAYDYIVKNYNVHKQIFAHGTSMGGVGATGFSQAFPHLVLAGSSFAGTDIVRYIWSIANNRIDADFPGSYGYADETALLTDKFSHADGCYPSLSLVKWEDGVAVLPPDRNADFQGWLDYYAQIGDLARADNPGVWTAHRAVPYKSWNSWADSIPYTKLNEILASAYHKGNACAFYNVIYESGTHTELSYGQINNMIDQLIEWYKRWE